MGKEHNSHPRTPPLPLPPLPPPAQLKGYALLATLLGFNSF